MKNHAHSTAREGFIDIQPNLTRTMYCRIKGGGKMQNKRRYTIVAIAVAVLFLFSVILTVGVDTDWGRVEVTHMVVTTVTVTRSTVCCTSRPLPHRKILRPACCWRTAETT